MKFTGQADVKPIHRFDKFFELERKVWNLESGSDKDTVAATRAAAFQLMRIFFENAPIDMASFHAFVARHLHFLPEASQLHGSRELFRLAKLVGADQELANRAFRFIRHAESLATPDVVACFEYLPVCVVNATQSQAECLVADCMRPQRAAPSLALRIVPLFVAAALANHENSAWQIGRFRNVVRKAAVACWNARPGRRFAAVCLDMLTTVGGDVQGVDLSLWRRAQATEELEDLNACIDFDAKIELRGDDGDIDLDEVITSRS
jgi:hypothetical protein